MVFPVEQFTQQFLTDQVVIHDMAAGGTLDEATYEVVLDEPDEIWRGPCKLNTAASSRTVQAGGAEVQADEYVIKIPAAAGRLLRPGMRARVELAVSDAHDPGDFRIERVDARTRQLTQKLVCVRWQQYPGQSGSGS